MNGKFEPKTLLEVIQHFSDEQRAFDYIRLRRWPNGTICPQCGSEKVHLIESRRIWRCNGCKKQFSVKVGTIFEDSPISFTKWIPAMWLLANCKNGISSYELAKGLGVTQKTAWFMLQRLRLAMQDERIGMLGGGGTVVEIDESYIGGKHKNMHRSVKMRKGFFDGGSVDKAAVLGMLERGGKVRTYHVAKPERRELFPRIWANVHPDTEIHTDATNMYRTLNQQYKHFVIDHAVAYVEGTVSTNSLENYWSLLKRTIKGTYVSVEPFHLFRYLDEQSFRYNTRKGTDADRFFEAVSGSFGRRLTYNELTGKVYAAGHPA